MSQQMPTPSSRAGTGLSRRVAPRLRAKAPPCAPMELATCPATRRGDSRCWSRSEEHTSELQSLMRISYAVFCLKKQISFSFFLFFFLFLFSLFFFSFFLFF